MKSTRRVLDTGFALILLCSIANAGTLTQNLFANGTDAASGVAAGTYTHLVDLNSETPTGDDGGPGASINGVPFIADDQTGVNYTLTGAGASFQGHNSPADAGTGLEDLLDDFYFGGDSTLTLTGLVPNSTYELRLFVGGFGGNLQDFSADDGLGTTVDDVPRNAGSDAVPGSLDYLYTLGAGETTLAIRMIPVAGDSFHWYGFSNRLIPEPSSFALLAIGALGLLRKRRAA